MDPSTITSLLQAVTKRWARQRKAEEREERARARRQEAMARCYRETMKDVAWDIMEGAYLKASAEGKLPAHARQIMYAARGEIQARTQRRLDDQYFTQTLLPDYLSSHPEKTKDWNVVFDARGHFSEPHTARVVALGTISVRNYLKQIRTHGAEELEIDLPRLGTFPTCGPDRRFGAVLFIEKEGFLPLFEQVRLAERYDLAIMSTKGMSNTASRLLVEELCSEGGVPLLVLHDFDQAGFSILATIQRDTRRYQFSRGMNVVNLGLGLEDVEEYRLEAEEVYYRSDPRWNLRENGATEAEVRFLYDRGGHGRRVELNAFASDDLVEWIEGKLKEHGVKKLVPSDGSLEMAYRRALEIRISEERIKEVQDDAHKTAARAKVPKGLVARVMKRLKANPAMPWDEAVAQEVGRHA